MTMDLNSIRPKFDRRPCGNNSSVNYHRIGTVTKKKKTYEIISKSLVQGSDVKVQALVHQSPGSRLLGVQAASLAVFVHEVGDDGSRLPDG